MATSKPTKKTTSKKALPKAQLGNGSGVLGLPNFEERMERRQARAEARNARAQAQGFDSVADKREQRSNRISKVLGTARSKMRNIFGSGNNVGNTVDSYNKGSYNKDSFNNSSTYSGRPSSIIESKPSGIQNDNSMSGYISNTKKPVRPSDYGGPKVLKSGGKVVKNFSKPMSAEYKKGGSTKTKKK